MRASYRRQRAAKGKTGSLLFSVSEGTKSFGNQAKF